MSDTKAITRAAVIGAVYAALTLALYPISYGVMQIRFSEALCALCIITPSAVPGIAVGCFIANILGPNGVMDAVLGTIATLAGCLGTRLLRKQKPIVALLPNVISNGVIVGLMLCKLYGVHPNPWYCMAWVGAGEAISVLLPGALLLKAIDKTGILRR